MVIIFIFIVAYACIVAEEWLRLDKAIPALLGGVLMWACIAVTNAPNWADSLRMHLSGISEILLFLLGAMTIVELIDLHNGFDFISKHLKTNSVIVLLWEVALLTFFLSGALDNLAAAIVMMSILRKTLPDDEVRRYFGGIVIIAANAGGSWSPIGDVTTTMLWTAGLVTTGELAIRCLLPAVVCLIVPTLIAHLVLHREKGNLSIAIIETDSQPIYGANAILLVGLGSLLLVPLLRALTGLPPFMAMLFSLALCWLVSEIIDTRREHDERNRYTVHRALQRISIGSILFFCGILLAIAALEEQHYLAAFANYLRAQLPNLQAVTFTIGLFSAVLDNVPLVAATMGMYSSHEFPTDNALWSYIAYAAGTGGSLLLIGSAAGVAVMATETMSFGWYLKNISLLAFLGYLAGFLVLIALS